MAIQHTTRRGLPYPDTARPDSADVPRDIAALALALDNAPSYDQGILANRPVSTAGTPGVAGRIYLVIGDPTPDNNNIVWLDYGTGWLAVGYIPDGSLGFVKLAGYPGDGTKYAAGDGTWKKTPGAELDYAQITTASIVLAATTEGTAQTLIPGNAVTYDGTKVKITGQLSDAKPTTNTPANIVLVLLRDATVLGILTRAFSGNTAHGPISFEWFDTPAAGSHTYTLKAYRETADCHVSSDVGGPGKKFPSWLRVTKA